ncbi:SDR family oxidoreductase [Nocardioides marinquilinus]|uniref:SDR family oxidoreductase n=1 Tax=Nocardioides marinquilinus TaxID=1210400 RepID=A0ABP9Q1Y1_9ACTN
MDESGLPLVGRTALVTGASRRRGIGFAVARRLASMGASVAVHHHRPHDIDVHGEADDVPALVAELRTLGPGEVVDLDGDLGDADVASGLVGRAVAALGHLDVLVCNHTHGGDEVSLREATAEAFDRHWAVGTRATLLLTQAHAAQHDGRPGGRVVWMTSGQQLGPMSDNLAYAVSKAALAGATASVAAELASSGILLNTVNPGPVNTGYLDGAPPALLELFPTGRPGEPDDPARLIAWLVSDEGRWMVGQVLNTEGGFRR